MEFDSNHLSFEELKEKQSKSYFWKSFSVGPIINFDDVDKDSHKIIIIDVPPLFKQIENLE